MPAYGWDKGIYLKNQRLAREAGKGGRAKRKGVWGKELLPARSIWGGKAFPQFLRQQEGKTEKFSFP